MCAAEVLSHQRVVLSEHAVDDAVPDHRRRQAGDDQPLQVVVAEPGGEHAPVLGLGKRRADAQAHRLEAVAVEVEARQVLAEGLAQAVVAVGPHRLARRDHLVLAIEAGDVVRAREHDPPHAVPARRLVEVVHADDVGLQDRLERPLHRDAAEVDDRRRAGDQGVDRAPRPRAARPPPPRPAPAGAIGAMSLARSTRQRRLRRGRSTRPRPPAAPVRSSRSNAGAAEAAVGAVAMTVDDRRGRRSEASAKFRLA